ncbi:MAG: pilus assembly protein TadG-related protein [Terracidiphilus sp.]
MKNRFARLLTGDAGQMMPIMALLGAAMIALGGFCIDLGHAYICKRELQASADAAALAGAYALTETTATAASVKNAAISYTSTTGDENANPAFVSVVPTVTPECLTTVANWGVLCSGSTAGDNAVQVLETATINTWFIRAVAVFGVTSLQTLTLKAESTAAMRGSNNAPYNIAPIIDTTASMGDEDTDASCNNTRIYCALQGVQTLLKSLSPCGPSSGSGCSAFDTVSLFTFPNIEAVDQKDDSTCPTSNPAIPAYTFPTIGATWSAPSGTTGTYQVTSFLDNYSANNEANGGLNTASALAIATGASGKSNCKGLQTPGGDGTFYAGAIYAAQSALVAAQASNPGSKNAIVILSDGAANTTTFQTGITYNANGTYPSKVDQCQEAVAAAQYASAHGTTVYVVAYGASSAGSKSQCTTDATLSPCTALQEMATTAGDFYSDATASQNEGQCTSTANPNLDLSQIFTQLTSQFTVARIIPNGTT